MVEDSKQPTTKNLIEAPAPAPFGFIGDQSNSIFVNVDRFEFAKRVASLLAASKQVPTHFAGDPGGCMIMLDLSERLGVNVYALMQSSFVVHGRPGFESKLLIALFNAQTRLFVPPLRWESVGDDPRAKDFKCRAYAKDKISGEKLYGEWIDWQMVEEEEWNVDKPKRDGKGVIKSKWNTMPGQMFRYRSASFFINVYEPGLKMGIMTTDELEDIIDIEPVVETGKLNVIRGETPDKDKVSDTGMYAVKNDMTGDQNDNATKECDPGSSGESVTADTSSTKDIKDKDIQSEDTEKPEASVDGEKAAYRAEWINLRSGGYSTYVHKNFAKIEKNGRRWPDLYDDQKAKWGTLYPKDPWPLVEKAEVKKEDERGSKDDTSDDDAMGPAEFYSKAMDFKSGFSEQNRLDLYTEVLSAFNATSMEGINRKDYGKVIARLTEEWSAIQ